MEASNVVFLVPRFSLMRFMIVAGRCAQIHAFSFEPLSVMHCRSVPVRNQDARRRTRAPKSLCDFRHSHRDEVQPSKSSRIDFDGVDHRWLIIVRRVDFNVQMVGRPEEQNWRWSTRYSVMGVHFVLRVRWTFGAERCAWGVVVGVE